MSVHTPGPWAAEKVKTQVGYAWRIGPFDCCIYVDTYAGVCNPRMPDSEAEANARLIAAAPDLLAACKAVDGHLRDTFPPYADDESPYDKVRAAIAKAEGRSA